MSSTNPSPLSLSPSTLGVVFITYIILHLKFITFQLHKYVLVRDFTALSNVLWVTLPEVVCSYAVNWTHACDGWSSCGTVGFFFFFNSMFKQWRFVPYYRLKPMVSVWIDQCICKQANEVVKANNLSDRVIVLHGRVEVSVLFGFLFLVLFVCLISFIYFWNIWKDLRIAFFWSFEDRKHLESVCNFAGCWNWWRGWCHCFWMDGLHASVWGDFWNIIKYCIFYCWLVWRELQLGHSDVFSFYQLKDCLLCLLLLSFFSLIFLLIAVEHVGKCHYCPRSLAKTWRSNSSFICNSNVLSICLLC